MRRKSERHPSDSKLAICTRISGVGASFLRVSDLEGSGRTRHDNDRVFRFRKAMVLEIGFLSMGNEAGGVIGVRVLETSH